MPVSANITTSGVTAFTLPVGAWGVRIVNESDTLIRRLLGAAPSTSGSDLGLPIAAGASENILFQSALSQPLMVGAIHGGTGDKTLTYEVITHPTQSLSN